VDPETEYWLQSSGMMVIVAVAALCTIHHLTKLAGIRTRQDLTDVEKIVQFILILMTGGLACGAGLLGAGVSLLMVLFCDNAPASACLSLALVVLLVGSSVATLSMFAFKAMVRQDDEAVWYLYFYPIPLFMLAVVMLVMMPDADLICFGVMSMSLLAMFYALAIRKPRHSVAAARPHAVPGDELR
jgi:hypothetical protein